MADNHSGPGGQVSRLGIRRLVAERVRWLRQSRGWSQEDLAAHAGMHRTYIGAIERSERNPSLESLERLAHALSVSVVDLLAEVPSGRPRRLG